MSPPVIAWTHTFILGWLCSLFFAAGYQLIPVITLNPLRSRLLSQIHFALHALGVPIMVISFLRSEYHGLAVGGTFVFLGFLLFIFNTLITSGVQPKWSHGSVLWFMGLFWLLTGGILALVAVALRLHPLPDWDFMGILGLHVHTMLFGFFFMFLIAASSKLIPMFMLSPERPQWGTWISGGLISFVLLVSYATIGAKPAIFGSLLAFIMLSSITAFYGQLLFFVLKKRRPLDAGLSQFLLGTLFLLPAWISFYKFHTTSAPATPDLDVIRSGVFLLVFLVFNGCILGMAQKIVPFMLWHHLYSKYLGRSRVPQTADLLVSWTLWPIFACFLISGLLFLTAMLGGWTALISPAAVFMLFAYVFVAVNGRMFLSHWRHPQIQPFSPRKST